MKHRIAEDKFDSQLLKFSIASTGIRAGEGQGG